jgi:hypothetical protein
MGKYWTAYSIQKHLTLHIWLYIIHLGSFYTAHYELKSTSIFNSIPYLVAHFLSDVNERIKLTWEIAFISVKLFQFSGFLRTKLETKINCNENFSGNARCRRMPMEVGLTLPCRNMLTFILSEKTSKVFTISLSAALQALSLKRCKANVF